MLIVTGCGRPTYPTASLAGEVTIDGQPLLKGGLTFTPLRGGAGRGVYTAVESGRYRADGVPKGPVRVSVSLTQAGKTFETSRKTVPNGARPDPSHYADLTPPDIDIEVTKDDANFRLELSRDQPKPR